VLSSYLCTIGAYGAQMPEIQSQTKEFGTLQKNYFAFPIYFANYLLLFAIKIKFFEQTDNNIRSFDHNKQIICYANLALGIET
jgi:hypothetical protein